jgi:hypothetical protein
VRARPIPEGALLLRASLAAAAQRPAPGIRNGQAIDNAWLDPILTNEWELLAWQNVADMTRFGMPGVFTHGTFDTWSPGYLMFVAASHNGISRQYETFGNAGADTVDRELRPED